MRTLFTCNPELGHFLPLTPVARALADSGHDVVFATSRSLHAAVEEAGFRWVQAGVEEADPEMVPIRSKWRALRGAEQVRFVREEIFGGIRPRRLVTDLLTLAESWRPDLFVREASEYGAMIAAELLDIPHAKIMVRAAGDVPRLTGFLSDPLQRLRATFGLPECSIPELMDQYLVLTPFVATMNTIGNPVAPTTHHVRLLPQDPPDTVLPSWLDRIPRGRPLVYVSLGTLFSGPRGPEIFAKLLTGLRDVDAEIVLTVGHDLDPAAFGPQQSNVHLERFLPLGALLPRCSLVVFHGGSGTLGHVVAHGLPMVILPLGADQPDNAARCAELGAARTLDQAHLTPEHIRDVVLEVLHTPSYRQATERLRDEFESLPGADYTVELLERLARDKIPIIAPG